MIKSPYSEQYKNHYLNIQTVYPSVFALKMFLGHNPALDLRNRDHRGKTILDVGFGDDRDLILFHQLGFTVYGIEVDQSVVAHTQDKLMQMGITTDLKVGYNNETGFGPNVFDFVYSCAALMYLKNDQSNIHNTLNHMQSILKPGGYLLGTLTRFDSHITQESTKIDKSRIVCKDPFYKLRENQLYWMHTSKEEFEQDVLNAGFNRCTVYHYDVD